jgi:hypothetical protein
MCSQRTEQVFGLSRGRVREDSQGFGDPRAERKELVDAFRKIVGGRPLLCHVCGKPIGGHPFSSATLEVDGQRRAAVIHDSCLNQP